MAKKKSEAVVLNGDVGTVTIQKAIKDNELKTLKTTVYVTRPKFGEIAKLCVDPSAAEAAMEAAAEANAKIEIPPKKGGLLVRWRAGKKVVCENEGATLRKITFDAHKGELKVEFGEPFLIPVVIFYADNVGVGHILELEPEQKQLAFEGENRIVPPDDVK